MDELLSNPLRLKIAHVVLGFSAVLVFWIRPNTFNPHLRAVGSFGEVVRIVITTRIAWIPYLISALFSTWLLSSRDKMATAVFIVCSTAISATAFFFYLNIAGTDIAVPPINISVAETFAFISVALLAAAIWRDDAPEEW